MQKNYNTLPFIPSPLLFVFIYLSICLRLLIVFPFIFLLLQHFLSFSISAYMFLYLVFFSLLHLTHFLWISSSFSFSFSYYDFLSSPSFCIFLYHLYFSFVSQVSPDTNYCSVNLALCVAIWDDIVLCFIWSGLQDLIFYLLLLQGSLPRVFRNRDKTEKNN